MPLAFPCRSKNKRTEPSSPSAREEYMDGPAKTTEGSPKDRPESVDLTTVMLLLSLEFRPRLPTCGAAANRSPPTKDTADGWQSTEVLHRRQSVVGRESRKDAWVAYRSGRKVTEPNV